MGISFCRGGVAGRFCWSVFPKYFFRIGSKVCDMYIKNIRLGKVKKSGCYFFCKVYKAKKKHNWFYNANFDKLKIQEFIFYVNFQKLLKKEDSRDFAISNFFEQWKICCSNWKFLLKVESLVSIEGETRYLNNYFVSIDFYEFENDGIITPTMKIFFMKNK